MNDLRVFSSFKFGVVRTITKGDNVWITGRNIASIQGYGGSVKNSKSLVIAVSYHVAVEERIVMSAKILKSFNMDKFANVNNYEMVGHKEGDWFSVVLSSLPVETKNFKSWVTSEVLPSLRKRDAFEVESVLNDLEMLIAALTNQKKEREVSKSLRNSIVKKREGILLPEPKAEYYYLVQDSTKMLQVIAKDHGWTTIKFNPYLFEKKVEYQLVSGIWVMYQDCTDKGYKKSYTATGKKSNGNTRSNTYFRWIQMGQKFIFNLLKEDGIHPRKEGKLQYFKKNDSEKIMILRDCSKKCEILVFQRWIYDL